jgi:hypothetical protein
MFSLQKNQKTRGQNLPRSDGWREMAQMMYTHVNECKNDKIK